MLRIVPTTQLAASFLRLSGSKMDYLKLLKLMYYADRAMLVQRGTVITFDTWSARKLGPVLDGTYELIQKRARRNFWTEHIKRSGYSVELTSDPGRDELNRAIEKIVADVFKEHGDKDGFKLTGNTHDLPEYKDPRLNGKRKERLPYRTVLEVEGVPFDEIQKVVDNINAEHAVDSLLMQAAAQ